MDKLTNITGQFSHPSQGIIINKFSCPSEEELSKAISKYDPSSKTPSQKIVLQNKVPEPVSAMPKQRSSWMGKVYASMLTKPFNQLSNSIHNSSQTLALRGEVPFERWYYHYQSPSAIKGLGQLSSRVWACAHAIESIIKVIFIALSLPYYVIKSTSEREMRYEALDSQVCSFLFSSLAIIAPTVMRDSFKKEFNSFKCIAARAGTLPFKYTRYTGDTTLKMLTTAH